MNEVILLPAVRTRPSDAIAAGFADAVARRPDALRLTLVDLPLVDLGRRADVEDRVDRHVAEALAAGRKPWLAGISLGGYLALLQAARRTQDIAGVALFAPWLGTRELHREFTAAGGLPAWLGTTAAGGSSPAPPGSLQEERAAWRFLASPGGLPVWLGHGEADRFGDAQRMAATLLPPGQVYVAPGGGHDWPCWADIWEHFLRWLLP